jgi:hypothetical protein
VENRTRRAVFRRHPKQSPNRKVTKSNYRGGVVLCQKRTAGNFLNKSAFITHESNHSVWPRRRPERLRLLIGTALHEEKPRKNKWYLHSIKHHQQQISRKTSL